MSKDGKKIKKKGSVSMELVHPNAAGIDIGDTLHAVAVPQGRDAVSVREFGAFTCDLEEIVEWLAEWILLLWRVLASTGRIFSLC
jgi:hypothetical protein